MMTLEVKYLKYSGLEAEKCNDCTMVDELPSLYSVKQRVAADAWEAVRKNEMLVLNLPHSLTSSCAFIVPWYRQKCGACAYFCKECWSSCHAKLNIFHTPVAW